MLDQAGLQSLYEHLRTRGFEGTIDEVRASLISAQTNSFYRELSARWQRKFPGPQALWLTSLLGFIQAHDGETSGCSGAEQQESMTIWFPRRPKSGLRIGAVFVDISRFVVKLTPVVNQKVLPSRILRFLPTPATE